MNFPFYYKRKAMARRKTGVPKGGFRIRKRKTQNKERPQKGKRRQIRCRGIRMSALTANPFVIKGAVHMTSPANLREISPKGVSPTMVWIYAEWCGHCVRFAPTWGTLVSEFPDVRFVMIDGDGEEFHKNYPETYPRVQGYPTLWLMGVGDAEPREYEERRDLETLRTILSGMSNP